MEYAVKGILMGHWQNQSMALTRDFKDTVAARLQSDPAFGQALLDEANEDAHQPRRAQSTTR